MRAQRTKSLVEAVRVRIRELRLERGLTREQLCEAAGLSTDAVSRIEGGTRVPTIASLEKLAGALRVPVAVLLTDQAAEVPELEFSPSVMRTARMLSAAEPETQALVEKICGLIVRAS